jgi:flavodoxin
MRKILNLIKIFALSAFTTISCAGNNAKESNKTSKQEMENTFKDKKVLVVYFSHTGENYAVGNISKGNTHIIADMIVEATGGTTFEIVPEKDYPHDSYDAVTEIARQEKAQKARPAIKGDISVEDFDVIFLGYPNWWSDMPMCVYTFIEKHNWNGKTVVPFCTHEGSGLSRTESFIAEACKGATVAKGLAVRGETAQKKREQARKAVNSWIESL